MCLLVSLTTTFYFSLLMTVSLTHCGPHLIHAHLDLALPFYLQWSPRSGPLWSPSPSHSPFYILWIYLLTTLINMCLCFRFATVRYRKFMLFSFSWSAVRMKVLWFSWYKWGNIHTVLCSHCRVGWCYQHILCWFASPI